MSDIEPWAAVTFVALVFALIAFVVYLYRPRR